MRQRASTKTQRRLKQQSRDPYALTDDVYSEAPTFRVGGLVTAVGVLQLVAALALGGFVFGGALLFCSVLLAALGLALLQHSDTKSRTKGLGVQQAFSRLLALRRSALDYSLTLSIALSQEYQHTRHKELQIAVVPTSPTPQKVVATMALGQQAAARSEQHRKLTPFVRNAPLATLHRVDMKPLPTINAFSVEAADKLFVEKPRANSEPKQVLRSRPLLPLKPKVQQATPVKTAQDKKKKSQVKTAPVLPKTLVQQESKALEVQPAKLQQHRKKPEPKMPQETTKKERQLPVALPKAEAKVVVPAVLPKAELAAELPKPVELSPRAPAAVVPEQTPVPAAPLPVFPVTKPLVEVARGEPAEERELVVTRKVLLYLSPEGDSVMALEDQEMEREMEHELELEHELESLALSMEEFPPLSPTLAPQTPLAEPPTNAMEPNFLMDIALEPISKPESKLISFNSLRSKPVGDAELRTMLDELDVMRLELDAAMARCTSLLSGEEAKVSAPNSPELEPEGEPIFCC
jgi:hypothetical protein